MRTKLLLLSILALLCSCEDSGDDYRYPSVRTDFACFSTDAMGMLERMQFDDGGGYPIHLTDELLSTTDHQPPIYRCDTLYRAIGVYELVATEQGDTVAELYSITNVLSLIPTPLSKGEVLYQDPVYLQSIWNSGGYLNMVIELKALNGKHSLGFVDTTPASLKGKEFTLYHNAQDDVESYRQKVYASIPLYPFSTHLQSGDTLRFVVNTYDEGTTELKFVM